MTKIQVWKIIAIALIFVVEPLLFNFRNQFSIYLLLLQQTWPFQAIIGFFFVLIGLKISWSNPKRALMLVSTFTVCCWAGFSFWGAERIRNTAQLGEDRYYLTVRTELPDPSCDFFCDFTVPALYKCNSIGLECVLIFHDDFMDISESGLVVDKDTSELQLFLSFSTQGLGFRKYGLVYIYGKQPRFIEGSDEFGGSIYYLTTSQEQEPYTYTLFKCNQDSMGCKRLPFEYVGTYDIEMDINTKGKLTVADELVVYTYNIHDSQPVCHIASCTLNDK